MATTTFNVSASYDKASYTAGETMRITLAGNATFVGDGTTTASQSGALDLTVTAENGAVTHVVAPAVTIYTSTPSTPQTLSVIISLIADTSARLWTIAADGKSATAVA